MVFPIHLLSIIGLVFCLVNENFLNCALGLVLLCFFLCVHTFFNDFDLSKRDKQVKPKGPTGRASKFHWRPNVGFRIPSSAYSGAAAEMASI